VMNADGSNQTRLTNNLAIDADPSFSPDGSHIVFVSYRDGNSEIYVMDPNGANAVNLTNSPGIDAEPSYSPDGSRLIFRSNSPVGNNDIWVMNADGTNPTNLTNDPAEDLDPAFSPDGSRVVFQSYRAGDLNWEIYVMNADGSNQTNLTNDPGFDSEPVWGRQADSDGDGVGDACEAPPPTPTPTATPTPTPTPTPSIDTQIVSVMDTINNAGLPTGTQTSLNAKLQAALTAYRTGDIAATCESLQEFLDQVAAQSGKKKLSATLAAELTSRVQGIRAQIGCGQFAVADCEPSTFARFTTWLYERFGPDDVLELTQRSFCLL